MLNVSINTRSINKNVNELLHNIVDKAIHFTQFNYYSFIMFTSNYEEFIGYIS